MADRWSQFAEDSTRLPEGFKRIGYDADTKRYTFCDAHGTIYQGEPSMHYGVMTPIPSPVASIERSRPSAFARSPLRSSTLPTSAMKDKPQTFQEFLPPELITSSSLSETSSSKIKSSKPLAELVRKSTLPRMQGVVHSLRRSVTSIRRSRILSQGTV